MQCGPSIIFTAHLLIKCTLCLVIALLIQAPYYLFSAVTGAVPFQELPAGKRFDAEHNMLFLLAALADIQHIIIILYITPFQIKAALPVQAAAAVAQNFNFFIGQHNA